MLKQVSYVRKVLLLGFRVFRTSQPLSIRLEGRLEVLRRFPGKFSLFLHSADVFIRDHTFSSVFVRAPWWSDCKFYGDDQKRRESRVCPSIAIIKSLLFNLLAVDAKVWAECELWLQSSIYERYKLLNVMGSEHVSTKERKNLKYRDL